MDETKIEELCRAAGCNRGAVSVKATADQRGSHPALIRGTITLSVNGYEKVAFGLKGWIGLDELAPGREDTAVAIAVTTRNWPLLDEFFNDRDRERLRAENLRPNTLGGEATTIIGQDAVLSQAAAPAQPPPKQTPPPGVNSALRDDEDLDDLPPELRKELGL